MRLRLRHSPEHGLAAILAAFVALAAVLSLTIPLGEAADEVSHYSYVTEIRFRGRLPAQEGPSIGEAHQPPLYYLLAAALTAWVPDVERPVAANPDFTFAPSSPPNMLTHPLAESAPFSGGAALWHWLRAVSVLLGAVAVWTTYRIARVLAPGHSGVALGAATLLAFLPSFLFSSAVINNDNLVIALTALSMWQWVRMVRLVPSVREGIVLGVLLGLAALTKMPGLLLWAAVALGIALAALRPENRRAWLAAGTACAVSAAAVYGPWLVDGVIARQDLLAWSQFLRVTPRTDPLVVADIGRYLWSMGTSLGGRMGGASHLTLAGEGYAALAGIAATAVLGLAVALWSRRGRAVGRSMTLSLVVMSLFALLLGGAHFFLMTFILGMDQARHVFAALPLAALAASYGLWRAASARPHLLAASSGLMLALAVAALVQVADTYAPQPAQAFASAEDAQAAEFGGEMRLVDARLSQTQVSPGHPVSVTMGWQAMVAPTRVYWLQLQLAGGDGAEQVRPLADVMPANGRTTSDRWRADQVFRSEHVFLVPRDLPPGKYALRVAVRASGTWDWLEAAGEESAEIGRLSVGATP